MERLTASYLELLKNWIPLADRYLTVPKGRPDLLYFGDGSNGWGTQTNQKAMAAYAVAGALLGRTDWSDAALRMLRYSLESHLSGSFHVSDSEEMKWGHTWISALGVERMMCGVEALDSRLTSDDRDMLRRMLVSEARWLLENYPVQADPIHPNVPESNMWNGALLYRTACLYPDEPLAKSFREKGEQFLMNAVSLPSEKGAGWFVGGNFFDSFALNHHGYMNVGYMVITISNAAMLYFSLKGMGVEPPAALWHNMEGLWRLVKTCLFPDGRLCRIGGDTRVRYCYCQDYLLPSLLFVQQLFGEDADHWEEEWLRTVRQEMDYNGDGSFLSDRLTLFRERSLLYYTRLESDRAVAFAFNAYYRSRLELTSSPAGLVRGPVPPLRQWEDEYHGSCLVRGKRRIASFTWLAGELPQGNCLPLTDSSLGEWKNNMTSLLYGDGVQDCNLLGSHGQRMLEEGFVTWGSYTAHTEGLLAEQIQEEDTAQVQIAFAALPDDATVVTLQRARAVKNCHLTQCRPLNLCIPNDLFNGFQRDYRWKDGQLTVDGRLRVAAVYGGGLRLERPPYRQIGLRGTAYRTRGMLHCDEVLIDVNLHPRSYYCGETVFDFGAIVAAEGGPALRARRLVPDAPGLEELRAVKVWSEDGHVYLVAANFSSQSLSFVLEGHVMELAPGEADCVECPAP